MTDTEKQRLIVRRLLDLTDENGRGYYPLAPLAAEVGLTVEQLYDNNTNTGLLWELGRHGKAYIEVAPSSFDYACIPTDSRHDAERFANPPPPPPPLRAYRVTLDVLDLNRDFNTVGELVGTLENLRAIDFAEVRRVQCAEIGEWSDDSPLNQRDTAVAAKDALLKDAPVVWSGAVAS
jgi:hypothetical protein